MLMSPSVKSHSTPSDKINKEQYIQCNTIKLISKQTPTNQSYFEEDQLEPEDNNFNQWHNQYIHNINAILNNPPSSPNLAKYYVLSQQDEQITLISDTSPETLNDAIRLRQQSAAPIIESDLVLLAYNLLNALTQVQLVYLSPQHIMHNQVIINYIEQMISTRAFLESEDHLYCAPELLEQIEFEFEDCEDFNQRVSQQIKAPKGAIYSLGIILLQCMHMDITRKSDIKQLLKNTSYSWSLREFINQTLQEESRRPDAEQLLQNPIFYEINIPQLNTRTFQSISLFVFLNLIKQGCTNVDWAEHFFSTEEIISICELKEGIQPLSDLKSDINYQINQLTSKCSPKLDVKELIQILQQVANHSPEKQPKEKQAGKQALFKKWFSRKKEADIEEIVVMQQEPVEMAQIVLIKLLATSQEKAFKTFMPKFAHFLSQGLIWQNVRKVVWPRALGLESVEGQREVVGLTLEVCDYLNEAKQKDMQQIEKDLHRSKCSDKMKNGIRTVLRGFINYSEQHCYLQGMETLSQVLLEAFNQDSELSTICLIELYNKKIVGNRSGGEWSETTFKQQFDQRLQEKFLQYKWLLNFIDPQLYLYLSEVGFISEMYVVSWFTNFFSREFPIESVLKIFDCMMLAEECFEILFAGAIMLELKETFQIKDNDGIMGCLRNLANNVNVQQCLEYAMTLSNGLPRNLLALTYQDEDMCNDMNQSEFIQERPWERSVTWTEIKERMTFEITIFDVCSLLRENKVSIVSIDVRPSKDYETASLMGSYFAGYTNNGKITPLLLTYLDLKGQVDEYGVYFVVVVYDHDTQSITDIITALLKLGIRKLCVLRGGIQAALLDGQDFIKLKCKAILPPTIKGGIEEMKKQLMTQG